MDSLYVNAAVYGLSDHEAKVRINELAEMLELGEELTRPVRKLSLGQRMKSEIFSISKALNVISCKFNLLISEDLILFFAKESPNDPYVSPEVCFNKL